MVRLHTTIKAKESILNLRETVISPQEATRNLIGTTVTPCEFPMAEMPSVSTICRNVRRWRPVAQNAPAIPKERCNFEIPEKHRLLPRGHMFLAVDTGINDDNRILIVASEESLNELTQLQNWAADGSFKICPQIYYQL